MKLNTILRYAFVLSAVIPATCMLFISLLFLSDIISYGAATVYQGFFYTSIVFGALGYVGLILNLIPKFNKSYLTKLIFCLLGSIGFAIFLNLQGDYNTFRWIIEIQEPQEWIIFIWPNVVTLVLIMFFIYKLTFKNKLQSAIN